MRNNEGDGASVLIAVEDVAYSGALARAMEQDRFSPTLCHDTQGVLRLLQRNDFDVILLDLDLDDEADVHLVSYARRQSPRARLILLFEVSKIERAIDGIRHGAFFYLPKNVMPSDVALAVEKAVRTLSTEATVEHYEQSRFEELLGDTPAMRRVL